MVQRKRLDTIERKGEEEPLLAVVKAAHSLSVRTDSMAGDSDSKLDNQAENEHVVRQPFLIGVAGGTASGKVGILLYLYLNIIRY